jgi:hypothetical protein
MAKAPRGRKRRYEESRQCVQCNGWFPTWEFPLTRQDKYGIRHFRVYCYSCLYYGLTDETRKYARAESYHRNYLNRKPAPIRGRYFTRIRP